MDRRLKYILAFIGILILLFLSYNFGNVISYKNGRSEGYKYGYGAGYEEGANYWKNETTNNILDNCYEWYCGSKYNCSSLVYNLTAKAFCYQSMFNLNISVEELVDIIWDREVTN